MAKLMEIIEKVPDFKKGIVSMRMLDTTFTQLTRKIGSQAGANYKTAAIGQVLSKELLQSLNRDQLALKEKLLKWQQAYNVYINSIKSIITDAIPFDYVFTSLIDYTSKYEANKTLADYYLLAEFVNAEKELYEFGHYWGKTHMLNLLGKMKEWSKTRYYGSSVKEVAVEYETASTGTKWTVLEDAGLTIRLPEDTTHDKFWLNVSNLQSIRVGERRTITVEARTRPDWVGAAYFEITRISLGNGGSVDDGYFTFRAWHEGLADGVRSAPRVTQWTGVGSPYFDIKNPTLQIMKKINLNVRGN